VSAFHKALERVVRVPMFEVHIYCSSLDGEEEWTHGFDPSPECEGRHDEYDALACPTKFDAIKNAKARGWTWDKDGRWLCPKCIDPEDENSEGGAK